MGDSWWIFVKLLFALPLVVLSAVIVLRFGAKSYKGNYSAGRSMEVVDRLPLNSRACLFVICIQGKYYLLGQQEGNVSLLDKLTDYQAPFGEGRVLSSFEGILGKKISQVSHSITGKLFKEKGKSEND